MLIDIKEIWNHEVGFIFPFYRDLLIQKIFKCRFFSSYNSFLLYDKCKLIGFIVVKIYDNNPIMSKYIDTAWISLLYVSDKHRNKGYGTVLIKKVEEELLKTDVKRIMIGGDYDNFFPGIPDDFGESTKIFFSKNGYELQNVDYDVIKKVNVGESIIGFKNPESLVIRYAEEKDEKNVLDFLKKNFYGRWYYEALEFFRDFFEKDTYLILEDNKIVMGFLRVNNYQSKKISYNVNWKKGFKRLFAFGPLGIDKGSRMKGYARLLIEKALNDVIGLGATDIIIDWTSLVELYNKFGFNIWKGYTHSEKILK